MLTSIFQSAQIREFELLAAERFATTSTMLMQRAGNAAFNFLMQRWPQAKNIAVICGSGNNGGDGYVLALLAAQSGLRVRVFQVGNHDNLKTEAKEALLACQKAKLTLEPLITDVSLESTDVIVDALLGIGIHTILRDETVAAINLMQRAHKPILSLDVPSGIDADSGQILGAAVRANATITFIGLKLGLLTGAGIAHTGELILNDLQLPNEIYSHVVPVAEKIILSAFASYLQPRTRDWHKGLSGHVLVIGGDDGYSGAPRMAALAALRVGAGLVSVATRPENATVFDHLYGTSKSWVEQTLARGIDVILEIDWQGHQQIKRLFPHCISIFILPPSLHDLKERLVKRNQDHPDIIKKRLADAMETVSHVHEFEYIIINDNFDIALNDLKRIIEVGRLSHDRQTAKHAKLIADLTGQ